MAGHIALVAHRRIVDSDLDRSLAVGLVDHRSADIVPDLDRTGLVVRSPDRSFVDRTAGSVVGAAAGIDPADHIPDHKLVAVVGSRLVGYSCGRIDLGPGLDCSRNLTL